VWISTARLKLSMAVVCCLVVFCARGSAQEDALVTYDSLSCDDWNRYPTSTESELRRWMWSFLAGESRGYRINVLERETPAQILVRISSYCRKWPLAGLAVAAIELMNDLADGRDVNHEER
jgi:hypothetical protein